MSDVMTLSYGAAIREALDDALARHPDMLVIGEGVPDPKTIFSTTQGLRETYGAGRVQDMPLAENGMTGICIGAALAGMRPVLVHQRIDFALLAMDQMVNNAAKWCYMFNGQQKVPLVVRVIIGRGWGQGPQHSQSLQAMFAQVPGLKVVMPTTAGDAYHFMLNAIADDNPVLFVEHRWLHHITGEVDKRQPAAGVTGAARLRQGNAITIAAFSHITIEALKAATVLAEHGIEADVVDMRCLTPLDVETVANSVAQTGHLLVADCAPEMASIGHLLISRLYQRQPTLLKQAPRLVAYPNHPVPTSHFLANDYYPGAEHLAAAILEILDRRPLITSVCRSLQSTLARDQPDRYFVGPF
ncbi:MAG: alpha-ketoacid dehydrogenase subunit beta [Methylomonas sp.]|nr:alpha-ketoacid dehydrogenase subunit beta [Methylomonas sp.]PPD22240.1 MAG: alpha-ketoacid dehydrogenase subunit beta [Methylomonas sp.]PPD27776.1 MAG: alpha-ketoacid dehydrogenase subunit beta [Methylomonas sp.]PPD39786.1 MAG: alpha-ketoacid dehydrogenase subunit beta [Methylomonas sp.]PPD42560.1 MAG: alpha-ketoacid dehydrogenase subunit beta [Methylomonas sp.]